MLAAGTNGQVLTSTGAGAPTWTTPVAGAVGVNVQTFTSSGTWTKPAGYAATSRVLIQTWAGGGAGSQNYNAGECGTYDGSGGGGGAYNYRWITLSAMGSTETITIGAGGTTVSALGGNTTVGSLVIAYGGQGGSLGGGFGGGQISNQEPFSTTEGSLSGGLRNAREKGGAGNGAISGVASLYTGGSSVWGGGGGGGGRTGGNISNVGLGGTSSYAGSGGRGAYTSVNAAAGSAPGGGGGGGLANSSALFGAGGDGQVIITVFAGA
jgi:hypothetical protein